MTFLAEHEHTPFSEGTPWMWVVWVLAIVVSAITIWMAVRSTLRPGEEEPDHVKRSILDEEGSRPPDPRPPTAPGAPTR